ncbi:hypothetical protein LINPERPRIM_LOCUS29200, partial [Linum perenne]
KVAGIWTDYSNDNDLFVLGDSDVDEEDEDPRCPTIRVPHDDKVRVRRKFSNAIIVSTLGQNFPFNFMSRKLPQMWSKKGLVRVSDVGYGFYIVKFDTLADFERAMFGGPSLIVHFGHKPLGLVTNWS